MNGEASVHLNKNCKSLIKIVLDTRFFFGTTCEEGMKKGGVSKVGQLTVWVVQNLSGTEHIKYVLVVPNANILVKELTEC